MASPPVDPTPSADHTNRRFFAQRSLHRVCNLFDHPRALSCARVGPDLRAQSAGSPPLDSRPFTLHGSLTFSLHTAQICSSDGRSEQWVVNFPCPRDKKGTHIELVPQFGCVRTNLNGQLSPRDLSCVGNGRNEPKGLRLRLLGATDSGFCGYRSDHSARQTLPTGVSSSELIPGCHDVGAAGQPGEADSHRRERSSPVWSALGGGAQDWAGVVGGRRSSG